MSLESRYLRFFRPMAGLSPAKLDYLTDVDQVQHVAWGAIREDQDSHPGLGVGRFIRNPSDLARAEMAFAVVDAFQRQGLGYLLLAVLYHRARQLGVEVLDAVLLPANHFLATKLGLLGAEVSASGGEVFVRLDTSLGSDQLPRESPEGFRKLLAQVESVLG